MNVYELEISCTHVGERIKEIPHILLLTKKERRYVYFVKELTAALCVESGIYFIFINA